MTAPRIQLLGRDNGAGLSRDLQLLADALRQAGAEVTLTGLDRRGVLARLATRLKLALGKPRFDLNLMLERVRPEFARAARRNVLVPNPEYFDADSRAGLGVIDEVWCKTRHAVDAFQALGKPCRRIGFASPDRYLPAVACQPGFFHGPGRSNNKGTRALIALWARHPQWPPLIVVWRRKRVELGELPANVQLVREHLDDAAYQALQNRYRFHLCPSQTEGFGHYLVEAMSCAAVVLTLDAPPMNELVTPARGVLVPAMPIGRQDLATTYGFDEKAMSAAIERCLAMSADEAEALGQAARQWFLQRQPALVLALREAIGHGSEARAAQGPSAG